MSLIDKVIVKSFILSAKKNKKFWFVKLLLLDNLRWYQVDKFKRLILIIVNSIKDDAIDLDVDLFNSNISNVAF